MSASYMDSSLFARNFDSDIRRVCIFGLSMETLSPSPQRMRTPVPVRVDSRERQLQKMTSGSAHKAAIQRV